MTIATGSVTAGEPSMGLPVRTLATAIMHATSARTASGAGNPHTVLRRKRAKTGRMKHMLFLDERAGVPRSGYMRRPVGGCCSTPRTTRNREPRAQADRQQSTCRKEESHV